MTIDANRDIDYKDHLLHWAWTIIANCNGGDWENAAPEWKSAAEKWRDEYHDHIL